MVMNRRPNKWRPVESDRCIVRFRWCQGESCSRQSRTAVYIYIYIVQ